MTVFISAILASTVLSQLLNLLSLSSYAVARLTTRSVCRVSASVLTVSATFFSTDVLWVEDDLGEVSLDVHNPFPFELKVSKMVRVQTRLVQFQGPFF